MLTGRYLEKHTSTQAFSEGNKDMKLKELPPELRDKTVPMQRSGDKKKISHLQRSRNLSIEIRDTSRGRSCNTLTNTFPTVKHSNGCFLVAGKLFFWLVRVGGNLNATKYRTETINENMVHSAQDLRFTKSSPSNNSDLKQTTKICRSGLGTILLLSCTAWTQSEITRKTSNGFQPVVPIQPDRAWEALLKWEWQKIP